MKRKIGVLLLIVSLLAGCSVSVTTRPSPSHASIEGFVGIPIRDRGKPPELMSNSIDPNDLVITSYSFEPDKYQALPYATIRVGKKRVKTDGQGWFHMDNLATGTTQIVIEHESLRDIHVFTRNLYAGPNFFELIGQIGYYLVVGIEKYKHLADFSGARDDAFGMYQVFYEHNILPGRVNALFDSDATKEGIRTMISSLTDSAKRNQKTSPRNDGIDYLVVYFSGRMGADHLVPYDGGGHWKSEILDYELESWLSEFPGHVTVILEGAESETLADGNISPNSLERSPLALKEPKYTILASSGKSEENHFFEGERGIFTHYLIAGLSTPEEVAIVDENKDGLITIDEIYPYVYEGVQAHTLGRQTPYCYKGRDLNTVILRYR